MISSRADELAAAIRQLSGQVFLAHAFPSDTLPQLSRAGDLLVVLAGESRAQELRLAEANAIAHARDAHAGAVREALEGGARPACRRSAANLPEGGCRDCGRYDAITGHQECQYPGRYSERARDVDIGDSGLGLGSYGS